MVCLFVFFLTARPWAERGGSFTRGLFYFILTARPWAERGSWFTRGLFYFIFFLVLSVTRPKLPLGQILNDATCDVYSPKAVETLINLISGTDFRVKKIKPSARQKLYFFTRNLARNIYVFIFV